METVMNEARSMVIQLFTLLIESVIPAGTGSPQRPRLGHGDVRTHTHTHTHPPTYNIHAYTHAYARGDTETRPHRWCACVITSWSSGAFSTVATQLHSSPSTLQTLHCRLSTVHNPQSRLHTTHYPPHHCAIHAPQMPTSSTQLKESG
jgi:hypothetical protein